jgi:protein-S-isoprenylcysteine O-methyltransferase Ste14
VTTDRPDSPGIPFPPPFVYVAALSLGFLLHRVVPMHITPATYRPIIGSIGWALVVAAAVISLPALLAFRRVHTSIIPNQPARTIVESGPYRWTRNPMYVGLTLLSVGVACVFNVLWPLVFLPFAVLVVDRYIIAREERYLERAFGEAYRDYRRRVRRWW